MPQKYHRGDVVHIVKDLGASMNHFESNRDVAIIGSYKDQYGGGANCEDHYTVMFLDTGGQSSWYYDHHLEFIRHGGEHEIEGALEAKRIREEHETSLPWIVANWNRIRDQPPGATMNALMTSIGITRPWGRNGEGIIYGNNILDGEGPSKPF